MSKQGDNGISWTDETHNVLRGCRRESPECENCYAEVMAHRFCGPGQPYEGLVKSINGVPHWTGEWLFVESKWLEPLRWQRPRDIFANSMSDLFYEQIPTPVIDKIVAVYVAAAILRGHIIQVLTKRPGRMADYFEDEGTYGRVLEAAAQIPYKAAGEPSCRDVIEVYGSLKHPGCIWGTSIGLQKSAEKKYPHLMRLRKLGFKTFLSCEPLIGPVDFTQLFAEHGVPDWVIAGAESGDGARPAEDDWFRMLRDICAKYDVKFHLKQFARNGIKIKLPKLDGVVHDARYVP